MLETSRYLGPCLQFRPETYRVDRRRKNGEKEQGRTYGPTAPQKSREVMPLSSSLASIIRCGSHLCLHEVPLIRSLPAECLGQRKGQSGGDSGLEHLRMIAGTVLDGGEGQN